MGPWCNGGGGGVSNGLEGGGLWILEIVRGDCKWLLEEWCGGGYDLVEHRIVLAVPKGRGIYFPDDIKYFQNIFTV